MDRYVIEKGEVFGSFTTIQQWNDKHVSLESFKGDFVSLGFFGDWYRPMSFAHYYKCVSDTCLTPRPLYVDSISPIFTPTEAGTTTETVVKNKSSEETIVRTNLDFGDKIILSKRCKTYFDPKVKKDRNNDLSFACFDRFGCYFHTHIPPNNDVTITKIS